MVERVRRASKADTDPPHYEIRNREQIKFVHGLVRLGRRKIRLSGALPRLKILQYYFVRTTSTRRSCCISVSLP